MNEVFLVWGPSEELLEIWSSRKGAITRCEELAGSCVVAHCETKGTVVNQDDPFLVWSWTRAQVRSE